jgi:pimeloyl-ACP methyl ester carboxylesterase
MTPGSGRIDYIESGVGAGPVVVLAHSSVSGARQWRQLMADLEDRYHLIAINLFGYGDTPPWTQENTLTLDDQAGLIEAVLPGGSAKIHLIGHSFGGAVVMAAARRLGERVEKLALLEANPFYLLSQNGRDGAFAEIKAVRDDVKRNGAAGTWAEAAEAFDDYWTAPGHWAAMPDDRRASFIARLKNNYHEWDAVMDGRVTLRGWRDALPARTLVMSARETARPIREIVELMRQACPEWQYVELPEGGHMAPLSHPGLVNPILADFLDAPHGTPS